MAELLFNPRGKKLSPNGAPVLWDANFFVRGNEDTRTFRLFVFRDGSKVWLSGETWRELWESRRRNPFSVTALPAAEVPPLERLISSTSTDYGRLTEAQERERMELLVGRD